MAEVQFAKSFLAALDGRPVKLPPDYVEDARSYPSRPPPMRKPARARAPGQARRVAVAVKSLHRNPPLDVRLAEDSLALATTSLLDVRTALAARTHVPLDKLRLLHNKKPVADAKVLRDLVPAGAEDDGAGPLEIELGVMVMGGAATVEAAQAAAAASSAPATAPDAAASESFWTDLRAFLAQRTGDGAQADALLALFRRAWEAR